MNFQPFAKKFGTLGPNVPNFFPDIDFTSIPGQFSPFFGGLSLPV
jgi:hypothetical protein